MSTVPPVDEPPVAAPGEPVAPSLGSAQPEAPRSWPPWTAFVALIAGFGIALFGALVIGVVAAALGADFSDPPAAVNIIATVVQDVALVGSAALFARMQGPARPADFGLRATPVWRALGLVVLAWGAFLVFSFVWVAALGINERDNLPKELGVDQGAGALLAVAALVAVVAPMAEEVFFRGYFFTALRNWRGVWPAAIITGLVFGLVHAGSSPIGFLAPLAVLGFLLCLLYERTGSLYPCIVLHSLNNSVAFGVGEHWGWQIPVLAASSLAAISATLAVVRRVAGESLGWFPWGARGV
jgi:membrane protease YdiL (CAAX protease family)